jgi:hypothetical protein
MIFRRSMSALHSLHIFFGVDVVVFCEGGPSLSHPEATMTTEGDGTLDTMYWSSLVDTYRLHKSFHFKSVGGKENVDAIARDIARLEIASITVCRDSDYDRALGRSLPCGRVAYTKGYSWENDVIQTPVLENLISSLIGAGPARTAIVQELRAKVSQLGVDLRRWTEIDVSMSVRGRGCLFDREKPLSAIDMTTPPSIRSHALLQRLAEAGYRRGPKKIISISITEVTEICYGRMLSKALYHTVINLLKKVISIRIEYEVFMRLAISETIKAMEAGLLPSFSLHVQQQRQAFA